MYHPLLSSPVHLTFTPLSILSPTLFLLVEVQAVPTIFTACFALPSRTIWTSKHHVPRVLARCHCSFLSSSISPVLGSLIPKGGLSSLHMPFEGPTITSDLPQTHPAARSGIRLDRPAHSSNPPIPTTLSLAEPTTCTMLPTMEPHTNTDRRTSSDFFPRSWSFAKSTR